MASPAWGVSPDQLRIRGHSSSVNWLAPIVVNGAASFASGSDDRTVRFWRFESGTLVECGCVRGFPDAVVAGSLAGPTPGDAILTLTVAAGTRILRTTLVAPRRGLIAALDGSLTSLLAARDDIGGLAVRGDDGAVLTADEDGDVAFTDAALSRVVATARCAHASLGSCAAAALLSEVLDGDGAGSGCSSAWTAVTGGTDHTLLVWDWARRRVVERLSFGAAQEAPPGVIAAIDSEAAAGASTPPPTSAQRKKAAREKKAAAAAATKGTGGGSGAAGARQSAAAALRAAAAAEAASASSPSRLFNPPFVHAVAFSPAEWRGVSPAAATASPPLLAVALGDGRLVCLEVSAEGSTLLRAIFPAHRAAVVALAWGEFPMALPAAGDASAPSSTTSESHLGGPLPADAAGPPRQPRCRCLATAGNDGDVHVWDARGLLGPGRAGSAAAHEALPLLASVRHGSGPNALALLPLPPAAAHSEAGLSSEPAAAEAGAVLVADASSRLTLYIWRASAASPEGLPTAGGVAGDG